MNKLLNAMQEVNNVKLTENGGLAYKSTLNALMDLFAFGGSYRSRSDEDCIFLFDKAFKENEPLALKCLFYIRDARGGQGERRFFRVVTRWLANNHTAAMARNLNLVPEYGRWDDLYEFVGTPLESAAFDFMRHQLALDVECKTPSLLAKWLKSENTSSADSRALARKTREAFKMTSRQYRKTLSILRERIRIVERLMSENRWGEIEFDKLPSKAGFIYRNAFARHDLIKEKFEKFAKDKTTKVNAKILYPCEVVSQAISNCRTDLEDPNRLMINKYWDNLADYFHNAMFNGVAVVDTSASMRHGFRCQKIQPIDVAISLGMYCAEKCNANSPWYGNYITFSNQARLIPVEGIDFVDKVKRIYSKNLCENTNIESVFDLILSLAVKNNVPQSEMPKNIVIISDMEFDEARGIAGWWGLHRSSSLDDANTVMEKCMRKYKATGYECPRLIFWNVDARNDTIPMKDNGNVSFVSGYSAVLFEQIMSGKSGLDLVLEKLNSERYAAVK